MSMMSEDDFWRIVAEVRRDVDDPRTGDGAEEVAEGIGRRLAASSREAAAAFAVRQDALDAESYDWRLWGAAYLMKGGCLDDAFDYFRGWLLAQGQDVWVRALRDPDTLADLGLDPEDDYLECEEMLYVGASAFDGDHAAFGAAVERARAELPAATFERPALGEGWDFDDDDEMRTRYPRLAAIYL